MTKVVEKTGKKIVFSVELDGKVSEYMVKLPDNQEAKELQKIYDKTLREAIDSGALLNAQVEKVARDVGVWDDAKENRVKEISKKLKDNEFILAKGGIKKSEAKDLALEMVDLRNELRNILSSTDGMYNDTCEARAANARFNNLVAICTKDPKTNKRVFKTYEDYEENSDKEYVVSAITYMSFLDKGLDPEFWEKLPENKFLKKYGFVNEEGLFTNKDGKLVNRKGEFVDAKGRRINDKNQLIDSEGRVIDEEGNFVTEFKEFEDD